MDFEDYLRNKIIRMTPNQIFEARLRSLSWMLDCFRQGTIRKRTIINLIPLQNLNNLLEQLEEEERYEDCQTVLNVINEIYENETKT